MNLAYILTSYPSHSETFIRREILQLERLGFDITVFALRREEGMSPDPGLKVFYRPPLFSLTALWPVVYTLFRHPLRFSKLITILARLLFANPPEATKTLINIHSICYFTMVSQRNRCDHIHACFLSLPACIGMGVSILTHHPFSIAAHARDIFVESGAIRLKAQKARFITCCTKQGSEYLKTCLDSHFHDKLFLNYHGIEQNPLFAPRHPNDQSPRSILAVGRLVAKKGFPHLIEAFAEISKDRPDITLTIVGEGPQRQFLENKITQLGLAHKIHLTGRLEHSNVPELMTEAQVLVVPSVIGQDGDRDGIPNVILEAFLTKTPVIASNLPGIREAVEHGITGLLTEPGDKNDIANAIKILLADGNLAESIVNIAFKQLKNKFNIENNCAILAQLFNNSPFNQTENIKIAHVVEGFVGGLSTYLRYVLMGLKDEGIDVTLIYSPRRCDAGSLATLEYLKQNGINILAIPMSRAINLIADLLSFIALKNLFIKHKFDIIHTHCSKAGALGRLAAKFAYIENVYYSSHCFAHLRCGNIVSPKIYLFAEKLLARFTKHYIAVSNADAISAKTCKIFDDDKCIIVHNGLPPKYDLNTIRSLDLSIKQRLGLPAESFVIMTACRLVAYKGLFTFINAARLSTSKAVFVIAGDGPLKHKLNKYIQSSGLSEKVKLLDHVSDMDSLYSISDIAILCSNAEGQPYFILEAMQAFCPVIASDVPGNQELLDSNRGLLIKPHPQVLARAVDYLLGDRPKRDQLAQNAYDYVSKQHRLEDQIHALAGIYLDKPSTKKKDSVIADHHAEHIIA